MKALPVHLEDEQNAAWIQGGERRAAETPPDTELTKWLDYNRNPPAEEWRHPETGVHFCPVASEFASVSIQYQ